MEHMVCNECAFGKRQVDLADQFNTERDQNSRNHQFQIEDTVSRINARTTEMITEFPESEAEIRTLGEIAIHQVKETAFHPMQHEVICPLAGLPKLSLKRLFKSMCQADTITT